MQRYTLSMRLSFVRVTVVATLLSLGCGNDAVCQSRIAAMRTAFTTLPPPGEDQDAHGMMSIDYIIPLPALASAAGQPMGGGRLLYVYADGTRNFGGTPLASDGELDIVVATQGARDFGPPEPIHLALEGNDKVRMISVLRAVTGMGLNAARDLVERCGVVKENVSIEEAESGVR